MERHFLKTISLLVLIVGCQQIEVYQENPSELNVIDNGIEANVIESSSTPPYKDVWDFIKQNNTPQNTNILNDQTLSYTVSYTHLRAHET